jgi:hypothetical protein
VSFFGATGGTGDLSRRMVVSERASQRAFFSVSLSALLFAAASAAVTIVSGARPCRRWARDADFRTDAARRRGVVVARHVWVVMMMVVMMMMLLPSSLMPMLWRYSARRYDRTGKNLEVLIGFSLRRFDNTLTAPSPTTPVSETYCNY